ncbi:cuticle protein AMP4-like [Penaeus japonicus]|uniref:cuticle protein AMP4-like n=1 Tax=Penaeus japonicus TaxID=27405 RepID=UPI001C70D10B|nr:cuticle protein AMP4-like [Penaeus japonicus]
MVALQEIILVCLVGVSACQFNRGPVTAGAPPIPILYDDRNGPDVSGAYDFSYGTGNGIARQESSRPTGVDTFVVEGSYSYTAPDGTLVEVRYIADENGFRAESPLIPTTPTPPLHSLRQIAAAQDAFSRQQGSVQQGGFQQQQGGFQQGSFQQPTGGFQQPTGGFQQQGGFQNRRRGFQSRRQG